MGQGQDRGPEAPQVSNEWPKVAKGDSTSKKSGKSKKGTDSSARTLDGKSARKMARLSGQQILRQADTALAAQANQLYQGVLVLLH